MLRFLSNNNINTSENRQEYIKIKSKYYDKVPIIVKPYNNNAPKLKKYKFLVNQDMSVGEFLYVIRNQFKTKQNEAIFMFFRNKLLISGMLIKEMEHEVLQDAKSDGFTYIYISTENTFG